jgi:predicted DCC family thiol-disulfide oxidoreductase YuxK
MLRAGGVAALPAGRRAVLIYDAECAVCRASALWLMRRALGHGALEILPFRSGPRRARYPRISEEACLEAMQLVLPDGRVLTDADAVPELLRRVRGWAWLAAIIGLPPVGLVTRRVYSWMAMRRMRVSCRLRARVG